MEEGKDVDIVYLDFAKAFDLVPRCRLIAKLKAHGVDGELLRWMSSWLKDRKQRVGVNAKLSAWALSCSPSLSMTLTTEWSQS